MLTHDDVHVTARDWAHEGAHGRDIQTILVVKLDHLGDFIIGLPALEQLRQAFPRSTIRLICGPWNQDLAIQSRLVDEVRCYTYFPQNARNWDGRPCEDLQRFTEAAAGQWDLAIDLRVDEDTRFLLQHADAGLRCGIGTRARHPFLDIILPPELERRFNTDELPWTEKRIGVEQFTSAMQAKQADRHEFNFRRSNRYLITGPGLALPRGKYRVLFDCDISGRGFGARDVKLVFDAYANGAPAAAVTLAGRHTSDLVGGPAALDFHNDVDGTRFDFRIFAAGRPIIGRFGFKGCRLQTVDTPKIPRLRRVELHIGEKLSLLVCLVRERTRTLYGPLLTGADGVSIPRDHAGQRLVVIAPTSNSSLRDWPPAHYTGLIRLLLDRLDCRIMLTGAPDQREQIEAIVAPVRDDTRLVNLAGTLPWSSVPSLIRQSDVVICNNSGIAHMAAAIGARTLALYSASHEAIEWSPRGPLSRVLTSELPCGPCGHDVLVNCLYQHACMQAITPEMVYLEVAALLERAAPLPAQPTPAQPTPAAIAG